MSDILKQKLKNLPKTSGIYQFLDKNGKIIYIWKSVNLFSRVASYFSWKTKLNFAKQKMIEQIVDIKTILTNNETESLILETTLIKKYEPKYNILMKDWKSHTYIKITDRDFSQIIKTRQKTNSWEYFWPYISTNDVVNIFKILKKVFWYGVREHNFFKNKTSYTLDKYLFAWNNITWDVKNIYNQKISEIRDFLKWNYKQILKELEEKMKLFAKNLEFERALELKIQIESIKKLDENQIFANDIIWNYSIINFLEKWDKFFIVKMELNNWKITWLNNYEIKNHEVEDIQDIIREFIENDTIENVQKNTTYISSININLELKNIKIEVPKIGTKKELLDLAYKNIYEYAHKSHIDSLSTKWFTKATMKNLLDILWYKWINKDIVFECNDISHLSWNFTVASRSIIENWKKNPNKYRKYKIKTLKEQEINDFDSMREVITRRIKELEKLWNFCDLIIIDGGKPQLSSVYEIVQKSNFKDKIQLVWIAKKEEILYKIEDWNFIEIILEKDSLELKLIQSIRDEAHRFAITFNRDLRSKASKKNILESLPGIWEKTRKKLLKKYWNIEALNWISKTELSEILNKNQIETLENHWII